MPAVSFVKPSGIVDGHPASSKLNLFEGFTEKIVDAVKANPKLWKDTAIFITFDEGGGYYDSGYVQPSISLAMGRVFRCWWCRKYTSAGHISHSIFRSRLDLEVHRAELELADGDQSEPR